MALLADQSADAQSNIVSGAGTNTRTFVMPNNQAIKVESVVATVDNTAGATTVAQLTVRDPSGQVIATRKQDDSFAAGDTGTATFALRLGGSSGGIKFGKVNTGNWLDVRTTSTGPSGRGFFVESANGVEILNDSGFFDLIDAGGGLTITAQTAQLTLSSTGGNVEIQSTTGVVDVFGPGTAGMSVDSTEVTLSTQVIVGLAAGDVFEVRDHSGNPLFRVDEDGDLHGKTGKALTFDL